MSAADHAKLTTQEQKAAAIAAFVPHVRGTKHQELILREAALAAQAEEDGVTPAHVIAGDRRKRWAAHPLITNANPLIKQWAGQMTAVANAETVRIWHQELDWITALAVARYGEAEDYWPPAFTEGDLLRAAQWQFGAWVPEGVKFAAFGSGLGRPKLIVRPT